MQKWQFIFFSLKTNCCGVAIVYVGSKPFVLANETTYKNGGLLLIETFFDHVKFVLINIYNCDIEFQQLLTLTELHKILQYFGNIGNKNMTIGGILIFFQFKIRSKRGKTNLKEKSIRKMIEIIESFVLFDIG